MLLLPLAASAASPTSGGARTLQPEEEDYSPNPYTGYGEFNEDEEEAEQMRFYQHGRLFGFGFGLGTSGATGERGRLWQGGFPSLKFHTQYWFDFSLALQLELVLMNHNFEVTAGKHDVRVSTLGLNFKYYLDVKNLSATLTFANPNLMVGFGSYNWFQKNLKDSSQDSDNAFGLNFGLGLEFPIVNKRTYFTFEGRMHIARFKDVGTQDFVSPADGGFTDLEGMFYTIQGGLLFTW